MAFMLRLSPGWLEALQEDPERGGVVAAAPDEVDGDVQVDVERAGELGCLGCAVPGVPQRLEPPLHDAVGVELFDRARNPGLRVGERHTRCVSVRLTPLQLLLDRLPNRR